MTTKCVCLRSGYDNTDTKIYYCMDYECHKSEAERLECIVTKTWIEVCTFLEGNKCSISLNRSKCVQISKHWKCPAYITKQSRWRKLERSRDRHKHGLPIDYVYSKPIA